VLARPGVGSLRENHDGYCDGQPAATAGSRGEQGECPVGDTGVDSRQCGQRCQAPAWRREGSGQSGSGQGSGGEASVSYGVGGILVRPSFSRVADGECQRA